MRYETHNRTVAAGRAVDGASIWALDLEPLLGRRIASSFGPRQQDAPIIGYGPEVQSVHHITERFGEHWDPEDWSVPETLSHPPSLPSLLTKRHLDPADSAGSRALSQLHGPNLQRK